MILYKHLTELLFEQHKNPWCFESKDESGATELYEAT